MSMSSLITRFPIKPSFPNDDALREVNGLFSGLRPGDVLVELSTVDPETVRALEVETKTCGGAVLNAPVSGSLGVARRGEFFLFLGGDAVVLDSAKDVLLGREGLGPGTRSRRTFRCARARNRRRTPGVYGMGIAEGLLKRT